MVQNIIKHAKATTAIVQLNYFDDTISLTIEDNGVGFPSECGKDKEGIGWKNIRKNIQVLSAQIDIQSSAFKGTTILIELPLNSHIQKTL